MFKLKVHSSSMTATLPHGISTNIIPGACMELHNAGHTHTLFKITTEKQHVCFPKFYTIKLTLYINLQCLPSGLSGSRIGEANCSTSIKHMLSEKIAWTHANKKLFQAYYWEVDDEGPWFSESDGFVVFRNCPVAPTYSLDRIGHFCEDIEIINDINIKYAQRQLRMILHAF